jgi:RNA polymerase sigma-70 factor (sigma-E family)
MKQTEESGLAAPSRIEELYRASSPRAYRVAYLLTGDSEVAADLTHDAFVKVISRFSHIRKPDAVDAYLYRTVVNLANGYFRRRRLERRYAQAHPVKELTPSHASTADERNDLWVKLQSLPVRQRSALVLRFYEDLSEEQTADILGVSARAVNALVSRGLQQLRTQEG